MIKSLVIGTALCGLSQNLESKIVDRIVHLKGDYTTEALLYYGPQTMSQGLQNELYQEMIRSLQQLKRQQLKNSR